MTHSAQQTAMLRLKQASTQDFDEQAGLLEGWNQHYSQLSAGSFKGTIVELLFEDIHLFAESTSHALFQSGKLNGGICAVGVPLRTGELGTFCGEPMRTDTAHVFSGDDGFEFHSPARLTMGGMVAPESALPGWLRERQPLTGRAHLKTVSRETLRDAGEFMALVFDLCRRHPALLQSENFRRRLRGAVLACMTDILDEQAGLHPADGMKPHKRSGIVRQAREFLRDAQDAAVDVEALCRQLGVSRRTLQYCFREQAGMNPVAYLRAQRLNGVRQMLKEAHSVTDAATAWGFWHFGHFSQEYKKLFGELPSDTLRRHGHAAVSIHAAPGRPDTSAAPISGMSL